jgi:hypothetical protein
MKTIRVVLENSAAIEDVGVLEVELAAGGAADERTWKLAGSVDRFHEIAFASRDAVDQGEGDRIADIDGKGDSD